VTAYKPVAWDGTQAEFWRVIDRYMSRDETQHDWAVLRDVIELAMSHQQATERHMRLHQASEHFNHLLNKLYPDGNPHILGWSEFEEALAAGRP
jgi:hypothetical protein